MKFLRNFFLFSILAMLPGFALAVGAIAVDDEAGEEEPGYGIAVGKASKDDAGRAALAECRKAGNRNCKVVVWFDGCGAYATSRRYFGVGWGRTIESAEDMAVRECGRSTCKVKISECDD